MSSVIIVGAGAAGLTAGYELMQANNRTNFKILEATMDIGGRLKNLETADRSFADFPLSLGGEWLTVNPKVLNEITSSKTTADKIRTRLWTPTWSTYDPEKGKWNEEKEFDDGYNVFVDYSWNEFFDDYLATPLRSHIRFGCVVNKIDYRDSKLPAVVSCQDGRSFKADSVIVTASPRVMNAGVIQFQPKLQNYWEKNFNKTIMLNGFKAFLKFKNKFYLETFGFRGDNRETHPRNPQERMFYDATLGHNSNENILGVFCVGHLADSYVTLSDEQILKRLLQELDELYDGEASQQYMSGYVQNWSKEPYVLGTYSHYPKDRIYSMRVLKRPVKKRIYFAGEYLPRRKFRWGFAHGAALSGKEAAQRLMKEHGIERR